MEVIRDELLAVREQYGDERHRISMSSAEINIEDQITPGRRGRYLVSPGLCRSISRSPGLRGPTPRWSWQVGHPDHVEGLCGASAGGQHPDTILCFSTRGEKVYWLKGVSIAGGVRSARGRPIINLLPLDEGVSASPPSCR